MKIGEKIKVKNTFPQDWWKFGGIYGSKYPEFLSGTVSKICKNGNIHYSCDQMKNGSSDGLRTVIAKPCNIVGVIL